LPETVTLTFSPELAVGLGQFLGDLDVLQRHHPVEKLDDRHLHAVVGQHVGELDADRAGAGDDDAARQFLGEDLLLVGDDPVAQLGARQQFGGRTGGDDAVVEGDGLGRSVVEGDLQGVRVDEAAPAVEFGDVVLLHQEVHALDAAVGHLPAALHRGREVEADLAADAEGLGLRAEDVRQFGVAQQRLGGDAAHVQADTAPVLLLDDGGLESELGGADRRDIPTWTGAEDNNVKVRGHARNNRGCLLIPDRLVVLFNRRRVAHRDRARTTEGEIRHRP
jgi:hypothetical protein